jgi:glutamyl-tRNA synthetase
MPDTVRVRFAPSPTGYLHVGGLRTALYNYLFARRHSGAFILRIEDTDQTRTVPGAIENLLSALAWAGLDFDEGPGKGGPVGPYVQSERLDIYREHSNRLIETGHAYRCFCSAERLDEVRKRFQAQKLPPMYDRQCRSLSAAAAAERLASGDSHVVRLAVPLHEEIAFDDAIRGMISISARVLDDQVLLKSDGFPTYHLANVVDDRLMRISHVVRGEEWLPSTPKHVLLYRAFGWELPVFAHLPLLLNADRSKLSKRQGDVAVEDYRAKGYIAEAFVNFVALLGWNPSGEREIYGIEELVREFALERVNKAGAVFNLEKLRWTNAQYLRTMDEGRIAQLVMPLAEAKGFHPTIEYMREVIHVMKERAEMLGDFVDFSDYFFADPTGFEEAYKAKHWTAGTAPHVAALGAEIAALPTFNAASIDACVRAYAVARELKAGALIHALRLVLTGKSIGPGLFELAAVLGRETVLRRIETFVAREGMPA